MVKSKKGNTTSFKHKPIEVLEDGTPVFARNEKGERICGSPLRAKPGKICRKVERWLHANGRCEYHGGKTPKGIESPHWKTGATSKYRDVLSTEAAREFDRLMANPDYTKLQEDIIIASVRVRNALKEAASLDGFSIRKLGTLCEEAKNLLADQYDETDLERVLYALVQAIDGALEKRQAYQEVEKAQEHLRRLAETENRRVEKEIEQIPANRATNLFTKLAQLTATRFRTAHDWLRDNYPQVLEDKRYPNPLVGLGEDIQNLLGAKRQSIDVTITEVDHVPVGNERGSVSPEASGGTSIVRADKR